MKENLEDKTQFIIKDFNPKDEKALLELAEFEKEIYGEKALSLDELKESFDKGDRAVVAYADKDKRLAGLGFVEFYPREDTNKVIKKYLPTESAYSSAGAVLPEFRGHGLQREFLKRRLELAKENSKETLLGTVRPENGSSLRNILKSGGLALVFAPNIHKHRNDPGRFLWEIDSKIPAIPYEKTLLSELINNHKIRDAILNGKDKIVISIKDGENVQEETRKIIKEILDNDYVCVGLETLDKDPKGNRLNGILFKKITSFPGEVAHRIRERKAKILEILKKDPEVLKFSHEG